MVQYQKISDSWRSDKPILIYGMGPATMEYIDILIQRGNSILGITDSYALKREYVSAKFGGYDVWGREQLLKNADSVNIVIIAFRSLTVKSICENLKRIGIEKTYSVFGYVSIESYLWWTDSEENTLNKFDEKKIDFVCNHLEDEESKRVLLGIKNYKLKKQVDEIKNIMTKEPAYFISHPAFALREDEVFVDGGTFIGDTIMDFYEKSKGRYKAVYGFEPDIILNESAKTLIDLHEMENVEIYNKGLYDKAAEIIFCDPGKNHQGGRFFESASGLEKLETQRVETISLDELLFDMVSKVTFIKMDIEGSELKALDGCKKIINRDKPRLAICAYHSLTDFYEIPYKIMREYENYHVLLRHHSETVVDTICYAWAE